MIEARQSYQGSPSLCHTQDRLAIRCVQVSIRIESRVSVFLLHIVCVCVDFHLRGSLLPVKHRKTRMPPYAFAASPLFQSPTAQWVGVTSRSIASPIGRNISDRVRVRMAVEDDVARKPPKMPSNETETSSGAFSTPSFDTTVFSDFVDSAQSKIDEIQTQLSEVDTNALVEDVKSASVGLVDNVIAGDWLNRGELYGAVQLLFALLLLRSPGFLDALIGFLIGPLTLAAGAVISTKALFDLGRKQLSIWPAPVPGAKLKTGGMYQYVRHPVYAGVLLACLGYAAATGSPERFALTIGLGLFLSKKISIEEQFLAETYPEYSSYQEDVPHKLIPRIW